MVCSRIVENTVSSVQFVKLTKYHLGAIRLIVTITSTRVCF